MRTSASFKGKRLHSDELGLGSDDFRHRRPGMASVTTLGFLLALKLLCPTPWLVGGKPLALGVGHYMKNFLALAIVTVLIVTTGCGDDAATTNPNAPIAGQPGTAANGWTSEQLQIAGERCAAYGLYHTPGTRLNNWLNFCACGYSAVSQKCTYDEFRQYSSWCINQQPAAVNSCLQSAGLSGGATQALDAD
jgi:hypothetical protein